MTMKSLKMRELAWQNHLKWKIMRKRQRQKMLKIKVKMRKKRHHWTPQNYTWKKQE